MNIRGWIHIQYTHIHTHTHTHIIYIFAFACNHTHTLTHTHIYICVCECACIYVCVCVSVDICTRMYLHARICIYTSYCFSDFFLKCRKLVGALIFQGHICTGIAAPKIPVGWQWNSMFFALSLILEGATVKVSQFIMPLGSIYSNKMSCNEQKCILWKLQNNN
jgi:hypothetical protein